MRGRGAGGPAPLPSGVVVGSSAEIVFILPLNYEMFLSSA